MCVNTSQYKEGDPAYTAMQAALRSVESIAQQADKAVAKHDFHGYTDLNACVHVTYQEALDMEPIASL